jgi:RNA polymerase sigma-70 factor (ECF subfamily)
LTAALSAGSGFESGRDGREPTVIMVAPEKFVQDRRRERRIFVTAFSLQASPDDVQAASSQADLCAATFKAAFSVLSPIVRTPPAKPSSTGAGSPVETGSSDWLERFRRGDRDIMESCYRDHFGSVHAAVGRVLRGADQETVVHDVFYRLLSNVELRSSFRGPGFDAWLSAVARNQAIDYWRRQQRDASGGRMDALDPPDPPDWMAPDADARVEVRLFVRRFRSEVLPAKWLGVFDARFLGLLDQREAARRLGISRTTLAYQELQIRRLLRRFVRKGQIP